MWLLCQTMNRTNMIKRKWFEIGHDKGEETEGIFRSELLSDCIKEFKNKGYKSPEYFIDIWESDKEGLGYPIAEIKIDDNLFDNIENF